MKVNLIYPLALEVAGDSNRTELPPLGMLYVASALQKNKHQVKVIGINEKTEILPESDVDGLAITASTTYPKFKTLARKVLSQRKTFKIAGNTHAHTFPKETLEDLNLDAVIIGESEEVLPLILLKLSESENPWEATKGLKGVAYRNGEGKVVINPSVNRVKNIDNLPFPARSLMSEKTILLENRLRGTDKLLTTIITSRGCPYSCNYCGNLNNGFTRYRSGQNFRLEVLALLKEYPSLGGILIMDETFTLKEKHVLEITDSIKDLEINYVISSRADRMNPKIIKALRESGCIEVKFGVESGSQDLLNKMNKKANLNEFKKGIKLAAEGGLFTKLFLMHGFPGENEETTTKTINMLNELNPYIRRVALYRFVPLPGSPVFNQPNQFDLNLSVDLTKFHIYHNNQHWWGSKEDFKIVQEQYKRLESTIKKMFGKIN